MQSFWEIVKSYFFWTYSRGSKHYDIMVTIILAFIFLTPASIFRDKPVQRSPHQIEVVVQPDGPNGFLYKVDAAAVSGKTDDEIRADLLRVIEPISGEVKITGYTPIKDAKGHVIMYKVNVQR